MSRLLLYLLPSSDEHFGAKARSQIGGHVWWLCKIWDTFLFLLLLFLTFLFTFTSGWSMECGMERVAFF